MITRTFRSNFYQRNKCTPRRWVYLLITFVLRASSPSLLADESTTADTLVPSVELVYSVNRTPESAFYTARAVEVITAEEIRRRNPRNLPELLLEEVGVFVQQTNYGGGSPIIRGLIGKQILILVDGIRLNNGTFRVGPLQYLNTIDVEMVDRVEIVRGVGSVLGSDALGGSINIITKKGPSLSEAPGIGAYFSTRFSSADAGVTGRLGFAGRSERSSYRGGVTYRNSGSLEAGDDIGEQAGTGYDELGINFNTSFAVTAEKNISFSYLNLDLNEVPRTDRIVSGRNLKWDFEPLTNQLVAITFEDLSVRSWADVLKVTGYWNRQDEGRVEIRSSSPSSERRNLDRAETFGVNFEAGKFLEKHRILYGLDFSRDQFDSTRVDTDLSSGSTAVRRGRYTDGATYELFAAYLQDQLIAGDHVTFTLGGRYTKFSAGGSEDSSVGRLDLNSSKDSLTGSASLVIHATQNLNLIGNFTRGFRAPNIDDLSRFDERIEGVEVPNPDLDPERIESLEFGLKYQNEDFLIEVFHYESDLSGLALRAAGTVDGLPFFDFDGDGVQADDEPNVLQKQNIGEARVEGFELSGKYRLSPRFIIFGNYTSTTGDDLTDGVPLRRIPPDFGTVGIRWSKLGCKRPWIELVHHFAHAQRRLNPSDSSDDRIGPDGTPGFDVFNLRSGISINRSFVLTVALENLTDEAYKYHASGLFRPGFQLVIGLEYGY